MKYIVFLLFLPLTGISQDIVSDTAYITPQGGVFVNTKETVYVNGQKTVVTYPYDTTQLVSLYVGLIQASANDIAEAATQAIARQKTVRKIGEYDDAVKALAGISPADSIARSVFRQKLQGKTLEWDSAGVVVSAQVNPRQAGGYNLRVNAKNYRLHIYHPKWFRVQAFPAQGSNVDLWLFQGAYRSFDGRYILQAAGGIKLKSVAPAPTDAVPAKTTKKKKNR